MAAKRFTVLIQIKSTGVKSAKKDFRDVGGAAATGAKGVNLLKTAAAGLGAAFAAVGAAKAIGLLGRFAAASVRAAQAQAQVNTQLLAGIKSTGNAAGVSAAQWAQWSEELENATGITDRAITATQSILVTFTKIGREIIPEATEAIADMATRLNGGAIPTFEELRTASVQLGKALQDPITGVSALKRVGVDFDDSQKELIRTLVETGDVAAAQAVILRELQTEFHGSASAAREGMAGALQQVKAEMEDVMELFGSANESLRPAAEAIVRILEGIQKHANAITIALAAMTSVIVGGLARAVEKLLGLSALLSETTAILVAISAAITSSEGLKTLADDMVNGARMAEGLRDQLAGVRTEIQDNLNDTIALAMAAQKGLNLELEQAPERAETAAYAYAGLAGALSGVVTQLEAAATAFETLPDNGMANLVDRLGLGPTFSTVGPLADVVTEDGAEFETTINSWTDGLVEFGDTFVGIGNVAAEVLGQMDSDLGRTVSSLVGLTEAAAGFAQNYATGNVAGMATSALSAATILVDMAEEFFGGTDEAIATFNQVGAELSATIDKAEGDLLGPLEAFVQEIADTFARITAIAGDTHFGDFSVLIDEDGLTKVFVKGLEKVFANTADALEFLTDELIASSSLDGAVGDAIRKASATTDSIEAFFAELDAITGLVDLQTNPALSDLATRIHDLIAAATKYDLAVKETTDALREELAAVGQDVLAPIAQFLPEVDTLAQTFADVTADAIQFNDQLGAELAAKQQLAAVTQAELDRLMAQIGLSEELGFGSEQAAEKIAALKDTLAALGIEIGILEDGFIDLGAIADAEARAQRERGRAARQAAKAAAEAAAQERATFEDSLRAIIATTGDAILNIQNRYADQIDAIRESMLELEADSDLAEAAIRALGQAMEDELHDLGESLIRSLSPMADAILGVRDFAEQVRLLTTNFADFGLSAEQARNVLRDIRENTFADLGARLAEIAGDEHEIARFRQLQAQLEVAQLRMQIQLLSQTRELWGLNTAELMDLADAAQEFVDNFENFLPTEENGPAGSGPGDPVGPRPQTLLEVQRDALGIADTLAGIIGDEELLADLEGLRHELTLANLELQIQALEAAGILGAEAVQNLYGLLERARDAIAAVEAEAEAAAAEDPAGPGPGAGPGFSPEGVLGFAQSVSPIFAIRRAVQDMATGFAALEQHLDRINIGAGELERILTEVQEGNFLGLAEGFAQLIGDEELLADLQLQRNQIAIAQMELEARLLHEQALLTEEQYARLLDLADRARAAFDAVDDAGDGSSTPAGLPSWAQDILDLVDAAEERADRVAAALAEIERMRRGFMDPLERDLLDLEDAFAALRDVLGDSAELTELYGLALADLLERHLAPLVDFLDGLATSQFSPLSLKDQFAAAQADFAANVAAGDIGGTQESANLLLQLAQQLFPAGSEGYASIFDAVTSQIEDLIETFDPTGTIELLPADQQQLDQLLTIADHQGGTNLRLDAILGQLHRQHLDQQTRDDALTATLGDLAAAIPGALAGVP